MRPETEAALYDVHQAVERIREASLGHDYHSFVDSWILVSAVERQLAIIGEALVRIRNTEREVFDAIDDAAKIVSLRNLIVHGYDSIDPEVLWSLIEVKLPLLRLNIVALRLPDSD